MLNTFLSAFYVLYTKRVQPDDDLLIRSKRATPLNTYIPNCVDYNCAVTHTGLSQHCQKTLLLPSNDRVLDCEILDPWDG
jgi:hypothetical protein